MGKHSFEKRIKENVVIPSMYEGVKPGYGIVLQYNPSTNTASVAMSQGNSDYPGEIYNNVQCPVTLGVQGVYPKMGMQCWVEFKGGAMDMPVITSFFNHFYNTVNATKQNRSPRPLPRFAYNF